MKSLNRSTCIIVKIVFIFLYFAKCLPVHQWMNPSLSYIFAIIYLALEGGPSVKMIYWVCGVMLMAYLFKIGICLQRRRSKLLGEGESVILLYFIFYLTFLLLIFDGTLKEFKLWPMIEKNSWEKVACCIGYYWIKKIISSVRLKRYFIQCIYFIRGIERDLR